MELAKGRQLLICLRDDGNRAGIRVKNGIESLRFRAGIAGERVGG